MTNSEKPNIKVNIKPDRIVIISSDNEVLYLDRLAFISLLSSGGNERAFIYRIVCPHPAGCVGGVGH
jgi:hypothetical protein